MATPFIKWVGGKRGILDTLLSNLPDSFNNYFEPFVGGGALFWELWEQSDGDRQAFLSDVNDDLITTYKAVKNSPKKLMRLMDEHTENHNEDYYYQVRSQHDLAGIAERAARFIFINKTGYNGLIRYNQRGLINTPFGHKKNPVRIYDSENIEQCSLLLKGADLKVQSYDRIKPKPGDFVYFDPPYYETYTGYTKSGFGEDDQRKLAEFCHQLDEMGVFFMLSNSFNDFITSLYNDFNIKVITAPRAVSCKAKGRKPIEEVLVTNYVPKQRGTITGSEG